MMTDATTMEIYRDIYYKSKMNNLLEVLNQNDSEKSVIGRSVETTLLKASTYFELNKISESIKCLKEFLAKSESRYDESYLFMYGRLCYMNNDFTRSEEVFSDLLENTDDPEFQFKSLQCLAGILYSKALRSMISKTEFEVQVEPILFDMDICRPTDRLDYEISLDLFLGNYYGLLGDKKLAEVLSYYKKAIKKATKQNWNYFVCRGLYGQAKAYEKYGKLEQMGWMLDMLCSFVDEEELVSFSAMVNRSFDEYGEKSSLPVKFDCKNQRIRFDQDWMPLHDRPLLYKFLKTIHGQEAFVTKGEVAKILWPNQDYKPRVHDPRIFDVAKRVRGILQTKSDSLELLSGRAGYRLISA